MRTERDDDGQPPAGDAAAHETAVPVDSPVPSGQVPTAGGGRPPFRAANPVRHLRGSRPVNPRPNPDLGPVGPLVPGQQKSARFVALREEYCAICLRDDGRADLDAALVLQQICHLQSRAADRADYVAEEARKVQLRPGRPRGGTKGWFPLSAAKLSTELFGAIGEKSVERAIRRLEEMGVVQGREGTKRHSGKQANEYRVDPIRLAELLAGAGFALPANEWGPKALDFDPGKMAPNAVRHPDEPVRQSDDGIRQRDDPRSVTVTSEDTDAERKTDNPLYPPRGDFDDFSFDSFDPADVARWQAKSMALLPAKFTPEASRGFFARAPVARLFRALYPRPGVCDANFARSFGRQFRNGRVSVARILACGMSGSPFFGHKEFVCGEKEASVQEQRSADELSAFESVRHGHARRLFEAEPGAEACLGDLAAHAPGWKQDHDNELSILTKTILQDRASGQLEFSTCNQSRFWNGLVLIFSTKLTVAPISPADKDEIRGKVLEDCAASATLRGKILAMDPGHLHAKLSLTPEQIRDAADRHLKGLTDRWARWHTVYLAWTGTKPGSAEILSSP